jgi:hypothetical protein
MPNVSESMAPQCHIAIHPGGKKHVTESQCHIAIHPGGKKHVTESSSENKCTAELDIRATLLRNIPFYLNCTRINVTMNRFNSKTNKKPTILFSWTKVLWVSTF